MDVNYKMNYDEEHLSIMKTNINLSPKIESDYPTIHNQVFSLSEFNFCVAKIINAENVPKNMEYLNKLFDLDGFSSDSIDYQDQFIDSFCHIFHSFLDSTILIPVEQIEHEKIDGDFLPKICKIQDAPYLLFNAIDSLSKIWNIQTFKPNLFNDNLITNVIFSFNKVTQSLICPSQPSFQNEKKIYIEITEHFSRSFLLSVLKSLINLSNYMSSLVLLQMNEDFFQFICWHLENSSDDLRSLILKLIILITKCKDSIGFHPHLHEILIPCLTKLINEQFLYEITFSILNLINNYGHSAVLITLDSDFLSMIPVIQNCSDLSIANPSLGIFNSILDCIDKNKPNEYGEIVCSFYSQSFIQYIKELLFQPNGNGEYSFLFLLIGKLMDQMWRIMFNEGIIHILVELCEHLRFPDRVNLGRCLEKFLSLLSRNVDIELLHKSGTVHEIFEAEYVYDWNNDDNTPLEELSDLSVQGCVIRGGALEPLINLLSSLHDLSFIKQLLSLIHHLITTGPIIYAEIANSNDILMICNSIQLPENNEHVDEIVHLISQLHQFYHSN